MRVISQDGTMDFSYEMSTIFIYGRIENAIAIQPVGDSEVSIIGRYSSEEKATKAMEMLREAWINEAIEFTHGIYHRNIVFQFPQDDEIEVWVLMKNGSG